MNTLTPRAFKWPYFERKISIFYMGSCLLLIVATTPVCLWTMVNSTCCSTPSKGPPLHARPAVAGCSSQAARCSAASGSRWCSRYSNWNIKSSNEWNLSPKMRFAADIYLHVPKYWRLHLLHLVPVESLPPSKICLIRADRLGYCTGAESQCCSVERQRVASDSSGCQG